MFINIKNLKNHISWLKKQNKLHKSIVLKEQIENLQSIITKRKELQMKKAVLIAVLMMGFSFTAVKADSIDITKFGFGTGISQDFHGGNPKACFETHYFFDTKISKRDAGVGPIVFLEGSNANEIDGAGIGLIIGLKTNAREGIVAPHITSFNLAVGVIKNYGRVVFSVSW